MMWAKCRTSVRGDYDVTKGRMGEFIEEFVKSHSVKCVPLKRCFSKRIKTILISTQRNSITFLFCSHNQEKVENRASNLNI